MKVVLISDTHNQHGMIPVPEGDLVIHAGDITGMGTRTEVLNFTYWFSQLPHKHKVFIAGNHDFLFEQEPSIAKSDFTNGVVYLENSLAEIDGITIYGSPYTPEFYNWAFMKKRGSEIQKVWDLIPSKIDVLVTHGPPHSILDQNIYGQNTGCEELLKKVLEIKPRVHVFGHIHESYGMSEISGTKFFNASILDEDYKIKNKPFVIEI